MSMLGYALELTMAKEPSTKTIRTDSEIVRMIRVVCSHRDQKVVDYVDSILRGPVAADYHACVAEMNEAGDSQPCKTRKKEKKPPPP